MINIAEEVKKFEILYKKSDESEQARMLNIAVAERYKWGQIIRTVLSKKD